MQTENKIAEKKIPKILGRLRRYFFAGILAIVPLGLTFLILRFIYYFTVGRITPYVTQWFPEYPNYLIAPISVVLIVIFVYLVGLFSSFFLIRQFLSLFEKVIKKIPIVKTIYNSTKQMTVSFIEQFSSNRTRSIVIVPFPHDKIYTMGLLLGKIKLPDEKEYYRIFIPTTPNISVGILQFYPAEKIYKCPITMEQAIEIIVSSGASIPVKLSVQPLQKQQKN